MVQAIIGLIFLMDPMTGQTGQDQAMFESLEQCEQVSRAYVKQAREAGYEAMYLCGELKTVHDGEA